MKLRGNVKRKKGYYANLASAGGYRDKPQLKEDTSQSSSKTKKKPAAKPAALPKRPPRGKKSSEAIHNLAKDLEEDELITTLMDLMQMYLTMKDGVLVNYFPVDFMNVLLDAFQRIHELGIGNIFYYLAKVISTTDWNSGKVDEIFKLSLIQVVEAGKNIGTEVVVPLEEAYASFHSEHTDDWETPQIRIKSEPQDKGNDGREGDGHTITDVVEPENDANDIDTDGEGLGQIVNIGNVNDHEDELSISNPIKTNVEGRKNKGRKPQLGKMARILKLKTCSKCHKTFDNPRELATHRKVVHEGMKGYECTVCQKTFTSMGHLNDHVVTHTKMARFRCKQCREFFASRGAFRNHLYIHEHGAKSCICPICARD